MPFDFKKGNDSLLRLCRFIQEEENETIISGCDKLEL